MKKILFPIIALILIACSAQVTESPTVTSPPPTETPIRTPTLHPDFVALQNLISDSSNLVLLPDGTIENNGVAIPNLNVDQNGLINIIFNNEHVVIETSQINFDDEGLTIDGYELNENGEWVEAVTTITTQYGLNIAYIGEENPDGSRDIEVLPPEKYADNEAAQDKFLNYFDAERLGFDEGTTKWVELDGRVLLVDTSDTSKIIAEYKTVNMTGLPGIVWNWDNFVDADGENPLLDVCKNWETKWKNGIPVNLAEVVDLSESISRKEYPRVFNGADMMYGNGEQIRVSSQGGAIFSQDGMSLVFYNQLRNPGVANEGFVVTRDVNGNSIILYAENMVWESF